MDFGFFTLFFIAISLSLSLCFSVSPSALFRFPLSNQCLRARTARPLVSFNTFDAEFVLFIFFGEKKTDGSAVYIHFWRNVSAERLTHTHTTTKRPKYFTARNVPRLGGGRQSIEQKVKRIVQSTDRSPERKTVEKMRHESKRKTQKQNANKQKTIEKRCLTNTHTHTRLLVDFYGVSRQSLL